MRLFSNPATGDVVEIEDGHSVHRWKNNDIYFVVAKREDVRDLRDCMKGHEQGELLYRLATATCKTWNKLYPLTVEDPEPLEGIDIDSALRQMRHELEQEVEREMEQQASPTPWPS